MSMRIAGAQLPDSANINENFKAVERAINFAVAEKADILLTPEGHLSGYHYEFNQAEVAKALGEITRMAALSGLGLALGTCFVEEDGLCYNQIRFYDRDGSFLGFHSKILLCGRPEDLITGEFCHYSSTPLRTFTFRDTAVGGLICNDLWANPEWTPGDDVHLTRKLAQMGVKIVFHAVNCGSGEDPYSLANKSYHESNLKIRAKAGHIWIATANCCYSTGHPGMCASGIISPDGEWACTVPLAGEQYYTCTVGL